MTGDLMELLQPHLENPGLERRRQQEAIQAEREEQERKKEEEQKRLAEMIMEIKKVAITIRKILKNSCFITIAKKMLNNEGEEGMVNIKLTFSNRKVSVENSGFFSEDIRCLKKGLGIAMNQGTDIDKNIQGSCIEILHDFLSTDNVKVTYE